MDWSGEFVREQHPAYVPLWLEGRLGGEWLALHAAPVYYGFGVPKGCGSPVIVVPGFLGTDLYLAEMRSWLRRIGYAAYSSGVGYNADCLDLLAGRLLDTVERVASSHARPVHLVGHSLGGILARAAAILAPHRVASVLTMGSPFRGISSHPWVLRMGELVRERIQRLAATEQRPAECFSGRCGCRTVTALRRGPFPPLPQRAVFTRSDGVVSWRLCVNSDWRTNIEVRGSHAGLAFNASVYRHLGRFLAMVDN